MFLITLKQVSVLLLYILIGYGLCRARLISKEGNKFLSKLLILVFSPAYTIPNLINGLDLAYIMQYIAVLGAGIAVTLVAIFAAQLLARPFSREHYERNLYKYMFSFANIGYFGYPLVGAVFGEAALANFILFCLPMSVAINSYGFYILTDDGTASADEDSVARRKDLLKKIFSYPFLTTILGVVLGLLPVAYPQVFFDVLAPAGNCYSVSAMLIAGVSLASYSAKELFTGVKAYLAGVVKLILIPVIFGGIAYALYALLGMDKIILICIAAFACLPAGMNVAVFPEYVGKDGSIGAKSCFISYIMGLLTIPSWFYLLEFALQI